MSDVSKFVVLSPAVALGEDVAIDLTGAVDPTGWTLAVKAGYTQSGPPESFAGLTAAVIGGATNVIRVTMPRSDTGTVTANPDTGKVTLYVEVWRTDSGNTHPLRRLAVPFYDPVFEG